MSLKPSLNTPPTDRRPSGFMRRRPLALLTILLCGIVGVMNAPPPVAQAWPGELMLAWSSQEEESSKSIDWGDWDGDGDLDLAVGNYGEPNRVYSNEGGSLTSVWSSPEANNTESVAWGDWDGDGDLDLAVGNYGEPNRIHLNNNGNLTLAWSSTDEATDLTNSVAWGDWDNDGDLDLAVGNDNQNRVYDNIGGSLILAWSSIESDYTHSVAWGDWDNDGDLDLAVGNMSDRNSFTHEDAQQNRVYSNSGGTLSLAWSSSETDHTNSVAWGDWDGDGDLDLAVGNGDYYDGVGEKNRVYSNSGGDLTLAWSAPDTDYTRSLAWGDWDNDGDLDLAVGNWYERNQVYANNDGALSLTWTSSEWYYTHSIGWGDWDNDGDLDLAVGNDSDPNRVYSNGSGPLYLDWSSLETDSTESVAWGDWDNDGDLDLAVGNDGDPNRVYSNSDGSLTLAWSSSAEDDTKSIVWGDWDGDGDLDLAVGNDGEPNRVYSNRGGSFTSVWSSLETDDDTESVAWGDWDNDGDLDLAVGNRNGPNRVYSNGEGTFMLAWSSTDEVNDDTESVAWGDWDNDGDLDLAVGNYNGPNRVYNNGDGTLTLAWSSTSEAADRTNSVAWGDWDNDGDLDLVVGNLGQNRVYTNSSGSLSLAYSTEAESTRSVAWGDWDGDGDLDLAVSKNGPTRIYNNKSGNLTLAWSSPESHSTNSLAWGDWDNDGDLDLAVGNNNQQNHVYTNSSGNLRLTWSDNLTGSETESNDTESIAWGDWDNDGDLDLAIGNREDDLGYHQQNHVYSSNNGHLFLDWSSEKENTRSVAWGDWDNDGDLDLAVGNYGRRNQVYNNDGSSLVLAWSSSETDQTESVAWGDWDGDGDLDLAVGNRSPYQNRVYVNSGSDLTLAWSSSETSYDNYTRSVAWGDWDNDGDLDLAVGNSGQNHVYTNHGGDLALAWSSIEEEPTSSVAWGDWDSDGDLDLAVGSSYGAPHRVYTNQDGNLTSAWSSPETNGTSSVAWGDWDNDGDLDLAIGTRVYSNDSGLLSRAWSASEWDITRSVAWGDWEGDGDLDLAVGNYGEPNRVYINHSADQVGLGNTPIMARLAYPAGAASSPVGTGIVLDGPVIPINYTLHDPESHSAESVAGYFSLDGGSTWHPAIATADTITENLTADGNTDYTYYWDVYASGVFGASDNAVFRLDVHQGRSGVSPILYAIKSARTAPFRLRGSQVRVMDEANQPVADAVVYRQPEGQVELYTPYYSQFGQAFRTNPGGYLQGYGEVAVRDQLVATVPMTETDDYTVYHTSASPTQNGLAAYTVSALGVQTLTVSADQPLLALNLDMSLEWDARQNSDYLDRLQQDIERTSAILYDLSNGQVALGEVTVYQDGEQWDEADVLVYADNSVRPGATLGGIVSEPLTETLKSGEAVPWAYLPGRIYMPPTWNRYGNPDGTIGEDWPRVLAHEIGHYALFLLDNYIGLDDNGFLTTPDCQGSAMTDAYRQEYSEFLSRTVNSGGYAWSGDCLQTVAERTTGRSDWETIQTFYPYLKENVATTGTGPLSLPLAVTQVEILTPTTSALPLPDPFIYLIDEAGQAANVQADRTDGYLFDLGDPGDPGDDSVTALGNPGGNLLQARGLRAGQQVCVYESTAQNNRQGCLTAAANNSSLALSSVGEWQPQIEVRPVTSITLGITVSVAATNTEPLAVQIYPTYRPTTTVQALTAPLAAQGNGIYTAQLEFPLTVLHGHVRVWAGADDQTQETISPFLITPRWDGNSFRAWGGNSFRAWGGNSFRAWGGNSFRAWGGNSFRAWGGNSFRAWGAPIVSADGQVILFNTADILGGSAAAVLQEVSQIPNLPAWLTPLGKAYRYRADGPANDAYVIQFQYLERALPAIPEQSLRLYYYDPDEPTAGWVRLDTQIDDFRNRAAAKLNGPGIYALMATVELPQLESGWNLFAYPDVDPRPIPFALSSIKDRYTTIYGWQDSTWQVYETETDPAYRTWVNTLTELTPLQGYWIYATQTVTPYIGIDTRLPNQVPPYPPTLVYGPVEVSIDVPNAPMEIKAIIDGRECGTGQIQTLENGLPAYKLFVEHDRTTSGCYAAQGSILVEVNGEIIGRVRMIGPHTHFTSLEDEVTYRTFLPFVYR